MRFTVLEKINATTPLAELFNAYMAGLSTLDLCCTPRESMHECRAAFAAEARGEVLRLSIVGQAQRYYELTVLSNTLASLYWCVEQAAELLAGFYTEHGGDLTAYAIANRRYHLNEYGGGEDDDWHWNGTGDPDAGEGWEVTETTNPDRLAEYSLHRELAVYFPNNENQGEHIGTSGPDDFNRYTIAVAHQTDFSLRKMFSALAGKEVTISQQNASGEFVPVPVIDQIEQEINEDIANERLTGRFNAVLNAGLYLAELHATMPPNDLRGYQLLHDCLSNMLAVKMEAYPPF